MSRPLLADALRESSILHDRAAIDAAIRRVAAELRAAYATAAEPPLFLTVMNGGMLFATGLALEAGIDFEFDYLHATRYRGKTTGETLVWLHRPQVSLKGRRVLVVDDILDEGNTLVGITQWCQDQGATEVRVAVLCRKVHDRCAPGARADHIGLEVPDFYVYGYGMDFFEQGRNLPAIYAWEPKA
ncbi:hypoxanthine-guanine phosphoribosyltransferase [Silanimonas lenta]|uniref:hypoxanthine-guanine phosphoribosyltransferase n=1 Tax=Silanimonas lenta TaxID=265429 RepID=UPI002FE10BDB